MFKIKSYYWRAIVFVLPIAHCVPWKAKQRINTLHQRKFYELLNEVATKASRKTPCKKRMPYRITRPLDSKGWCTHTPKQPPLAILLAWRLKVTRGRWTKRASRVHLVPGNSVYSRIPLGYLLCQLIHTLDKNGLMYKVSWLSWLLVGAINQSVSTLSLSKKIMQYLSCHCKTHPYWMTKVSQGALQVKVTNNIFEIKHQHFIWCVW